MKTLKKTFLLGILLVGVGGGVHGKDWEELKFYEKIAVLKDCIQDDDVACVGRFVDQDIQLIGINKFRLEQDKSLLWFACDKGAKKVVKMLLKKGATIDKELLQIAVEKNYPGILSRLLKHAQKKIRDDSFDRNLLNLAIQKEHMGCAAVLMKYGVKDENGNSPLHIVVQEFLEESQKSINFIKNTLSWFYINNVDFATKSKDGLTVLHLLAKSDDQRALDVGEVLFRKNEKLLDVKAGMMRQNPIALAAYKGNIKFVETIFRAKTEMLYDNMVLPTIKSLVSGEKLYDIRSTVRSYLFDRKTIDEMKSTLSSYVADSEKKSFISEISIPIKRCVEKYTLWTKKYISDDFAWALPFSRAIQGAHDYLAIELRRELASGLENKIKPEKIHGAIRVKMDYKMGKYEKAMKFLLDRGAKMKPGLDEKYWILNRAKGLSNSLVSYSKNVKNKEHKKHFEQAAEVFKKRIVNYLDRKAPKIA